jgi:predicted transcriptional regulator of viral defense system
MGQLASTNRRRLRAAANRGYITPEIAEQVGVPPIEVRKLASRGGLDHVSRGVYRFPDLVDDERAPFYEAVLSVGSDAYLTRDSVLAFHDLALVNPRRIRVGTTRRVRRSLPDHIEVIRDDLPAADRTVYDGLPSATVERALRDCIAIVMGDRLADAADRARDVGLIRRRDHAGLIGEIGAAR